MERQHVERFQRVANCGGYQGAGLVAVEDVQFRTCDPWRSHGIADVTMNEAEAKGVGECLVQYAVAVADRPRRQTLAELSVQALQVQRRQLHQRQVADRWDDVTGEQFAVSNVGRRPDSRLRDFG
jgi:hypothetical protein